MIPKNYEEWIDCITNKCKINISEQFITERLKVYTQTNNSETIRFKKLYSETHLNNLISWLEIAKSNYV